LGRSAHPTSVSGFQPAPGQPGAGVLAEAGLRIFERDEAWMSQENDRIGGAGSAEAAAANGPARHG